MNKFVTDTFTTVLILYAIISSMYICFKYTMMYELYKLKKCKYLIMLLI